jgi:hypothetical protein
MLMPSSYSPFTPHLRGPPTQHHYASTYDSFSYDFNAFYDNPHVRNTVFKFAAAGPTPTYFDPYMPSTWTLAWTVDLTNMLLVFYLFLWSLLVLYTNLLLGQGARSGNPLTRLGQSVLVFQHRLILALIVAEEDCSIESVTEAAINELISSGRTDELLDLLRSMDEPDNST